MMRVHRYCLRGEFDRVYRSAAQTVKWRASLARLFPVTSERLEERIDAVRG